MSLVSKSEVEEELDIFPGIRADECYDDFVAISMFLAEPGSVVQALTHLEKRIEAKAETAWRSSEDYRTRRLFYLENGIDLSTLDSLKKGRLVMHLSGERKSSYFSHLISSSLTDLEVAQCFEVAGPVWAMRAQYYLGPLAPDAFREQIRAGRPPAKDPYVDPGHGEYTHRLQWYAVMAAAQSGKLKLRQSVVKVYKAIGRYAAPEGAYQESFQWGLWDALCDRDNGTAAVVPFKAVDSTDFRCPNCLNLWLQENGWERGLNLLSQFLKGRFAKHRPRNPLDYAARKVYGKDSYDQLLPKQQRTLETKLGKEMRGIYDPNVGWR